MKGISRHIIIWVIFLTTACLGMGSAVAKDVPMFLKATQFPKKVYDGERVIYEVTLFTTNPNIVGIDLLEPPTFSDLPFMPTSGDKELSKVKLNGKEYFKLVIDRYFIGSNGKGDYRIGGGTYRIVDLHRLRARTLFEGDVVVDKPVENDLSLAPTILKVSELPSKGKPESFSGAVGNFTINVVPPENNPEVDKSCSLTVLISGEGDLSEAILPDIMHSFPASLGFRSMTDSRTHFVKDSRLGSEIEVEVTFSPRKSGVFEIGKIGFLFFNPETAKYEIRFSEPVKIEVLESSPSSISEPPPTQIDI